MSNRSSPGMTDGLVAARQSDVAQMRGPLEVRVVGDEELAAPNGAIGSEPGAVPCHADYLAGETVLGHASGDVGVMMLHGQGLNVFGRGARSAYLLLA